MITADNFKVTHAAKFEFFAHVDDLNVRLRAATESLSAVHEAMEHGNMDADFYNGAIFGVLLHLQALSAELGEMVNDKNVTFPCVIVQEAK